MSVAERKVFTILLLPLHQMDVCFSIPGVGYSSYCFPHIHIKRHIWIGLHLIIIWVTSFLSSLTKTNTKPSKKESIAMKCRWCLIGPVKEVTLLGFYFRASYSVHSSWSCDLVMTKSNLCSHRHITGHYTLQYGPMSVMFRHWKYFGHIMYYNIRKESFCITMRWI